MDRVDFRSDTVTWPTPHMREAMAQARVGDDVYGEDPTVNELQALAAQMTGKEAGLFVASGTMGNLTAILTHATRGEEAIVGEDAHTFSWEAGGMAALGGITPRPLPTDRFGRMDVDRVRTAVRPDDPHLPRTKLILVENSYGAKNGYPIPPDYFASLRQIADERDLRIHMDGARLFNAAVALNLPPSEVTRRVDSVSFCLSKGLGAPVGSVLCGSADFIHQARRIRKSLGGGMRQAGILAAAGIVALTEMVERLADDHALARQLAEGLAQIPGLVVDLDTVKTNIVFFGLTDDVPYAAPQIADKIQQETGILLGAESERGFRAVTHCWIKESDVRTLIAGFQAALVG
ncbi:MAG: low-specificity L-threonine aldolase [Anaerolineae bacterium]